MTELRNINFEKNIVLYLIDAYFDIAVFASQLHAIQFTVKEYAFVYDLLVNSFTNKQKTGRTVISDLCNKNNLQHAWLYDACEISNLEEAQTVAVTLSDLAYRRLLHHEFGKATSNLKDFQQDTNNIIKDTVSALTNTVSVDPNTTIDKIYIDFINKMETIRTGKQLKFGFDKIDRLIPALIPGHLAIIGAFTGTGKSFFVLQVIENIIEQGGHVALFSTEMRGFENLGRLLGNKTGKGYQSFWFSKEKYLKSKEIEGYIKKYNEHLHIYHSVRTIKGIETECRKLITKNKLDVVVIDFIQSLDIGNKKVYEGFREISAGVQRITQNLDITMILASQFSNSAEKAGSKGILEYKNAGEIATIADIGIRLFGNAIQYKENMGTRYKLPAGYKPILCDLHKTRHVKGGNVPMLLQFPSGKFAEAPPKYNWVDLQIRDDYYRMNH